MSKVSRDNNDGLEKLISGVSLTEEQAKAIYAQGRDAVVWTLLQLFAQARGRPSPVSTRILILCLDYPRRDSNMQPTH